MATEASTSSRPRLLVFVCHEAWVYQLAGMNFDLDLVVGLPGRHTRDWDAQMRPLPPNGRLIHLPDALKATASYHCIVAHNITDLLDVKSLAGPRLIVLHSTLEGRRIEEKSTIQPQQMSAMLKQYLQLIHGHAVAASTLKGRSWGLCDDVVPFGADADDYQPYTGEIAAGLRICNYVDSRRKILLWPLHEVAFAGLPVRIVGHNPSMPGVSAAKDWGELKGFLQSHRFYIHTADPALEDGYNMSAFEAMAAGMPVIGNRHPTSPIEHGVSGFLSDDGAELRSYAQKLLADRELAAKMGQAARRTVMARFSLQRFREGFAKSIETARKKYASS